MWPFSPYQEFRIQVLRVGEIFTDGREYQLSFGTRTLADRKPFRLIANPLIFPDAGYTKTGDIVFLEYKKARRIFWPWNQCMKLRRFQNLTFEAEALSSPDEEPTTEIGKCI